ncbi:uncharacterized protein TNCV_2994221 [Trichonephila clavipes]|nr:uncharacterized protein TNCV_2994221 [Trichonephila clavipes]
MYNKLLLYTAVLRPILTYGSPVWGYAADSNIKILEVAQNSLIRNIVKADRYTRNSKIYEDVKILPFKAYIQNLAISFFNNLLNINNENVKMLNNYIPVPDLNRPRRILLDSYNPPLTFNLVTRRVHLIPSATFRCFVNSKASRRSCKIIPPKRRAIGRSTPQARKRRALRASESDEQRALRLENLRVHATETRSSESSDQREVRLETDRIRTNQIRSSERTELRERRLQNVRISTARSRRTLHADLNLAFHYDSNNDYSLHPNVVIGKMDKICIYCSALKFKNETRGMCCASGKVKLPELHSPPEPLSTFLSGVTRVSKHFLENIRKYNSCFQMTSFGATNIVRENYMLTFRVQGQIYHHAGSLLPLPDADHKFLQICFMANSDEQIEQHCHYNAGTRRGIVGALQGLFDQHNELVRLFKTAIQRMPADDYAVVIRADKRPVGQHERQFNAPTIDEVAIVIVGEEFESRDIILHRRSGDIQRVSETHRSYDGLQYPILFWRGDDGYHFNIKMINPQTDAPGGTGKTFLLSLILATIRSQNNIAVAIASSGIAATLLDGGRTTHSALKLPLNLQNTEAPTCNISKNSGMGKVL